MALLPDLGDQMGTDPVGTRFDHGETDGGGQGGVDRITPLSDHLETGGGSQRLARGNHGMGSQQGRPTTDVGW